MKILLMITGGSGSGKSTLEQQLIDTKMFINAISTTTREIRAEEKNGVNYHYVTEDNFNKIDDMIEQVEFNGNYYGLRSGELFKSKKDTVLVIEPNGILQVLDYIETNKLDIFPVIVHLNIKEKERFKNMMKRGHNIIEITDRLEADEIDKDIERFDIVPDIVIKKLMPDLDKHIIGQLHRIKKII